MEILEIKEEIYEVKRAAVWSVYLIENQIECGGCFGIVGERKQPVKIYLLLVCIN